LADKRKTESATLTAARSAIAQLVELSAVLAKAGARDRGNVERHVAGGATENSDHATVWRKLVRVLGTLAPLPIQTAGQHTVLFFVPDGKYRMQVFAMEDLPDGGVSIYTPDASAEAIKAGVLINQRSDDDTTFFDLSADGVAPAPVELLTAANTPNPPSHAKNMLGWNRKALRITLPLPASESQISAVADVCVLAARTWFSKLPAPGTEPAKGGAAATAAAPKSNGVAKVEPAKAPPRPATTVKAVEPAKSVAPGKAVATAKGSASKAAPRKATARKD
jgi:hypothetical protein